MFNDFKKLLEANCLFGSIILLLGLKRVESGWTFRRDPRLVLPSLFFIGIWRILTLFFLGKLIILTLFFLGIWSILTLLLANEVF